MEKVVGYTYFARNDMIGIIFEREDGTYWNWLFDGIDWRKYFSQRETSISKPHVEVFVNDERNALLGCSCAGFETFGEAMRDLL